jgi:hypothetical protein
VDIMKANYVNELAEGAKVDAPFALRTKEMRAARTGDAYLSLDLADRTGQIAAVCFRPDASATAVPVGAVVRVRGTVTSYRGVKRISVESMRPAQTSDAGDFIAQSVRDLAEVETVHSLPRSATRVCATCCALSSATRGSSHASHAAPARSPTTTRISAGSWSTRSPSRRSLARCPSSTRASMRMCS